MFVKYSRPTRARRRRPTRLPRPAAAAARRRPVPRERALGEEAQVAVRLAVADRVQRRPAEQQQPRRGEARRRRGRRAGGVGERLGGNVKVDDVGVAGEPGCGRRAAQLHWRRRTCPATNARPGVERRGRPRARASAAVPAVAVAAPRVAADDASSAPPRTSGAAQGGVRRPRAEESTRVARAAPVVLGSAPTKEDCRCAWEGKGEALGTGAPS